MSHLLSTCQLSVMSLMAFFSLDAVRKHLLALPMAMPKTGIQAKLWAPVCAALERRHSLLWV